MNIFFQSKTFLQYQLAAKGLNSIHSPFVFQLATQVLKDKRHYYAFDEINQLRKLLEEKNETVQIVEYGAGSTTNTSKQRAVKDLASAVAIPEKYGKVLFKLVNHLQPKTIVELGTSLGISTAYLAKADSQIQVYSFEGNPHCAAVARKNFEWLKMEKIKIVEGNFDTTVASFIPQMQQPIDLAFVDGNHRYQPTVDYFAILKTKSTENTCLIFHDIHWSPEMQQAWNEMKASPEVSISVDIYNMGMLFFKQGVPKQDFVIRY